MDEIGRVDFTAEGLDGHHLSSDMILKILRRAGDPKFKKAKKTDIGGMSQVEVTVRLMLDLTDQDGDFGVKALKALIAKLRRGGGPAP